MSIYIAASETFNNKVKLGITFDPVHRISNMQTANPEPVRYLRIYTITDSNDVTLVQLETYIHSVCKHYKYCSKAFQEYECKPTEFFLYNIVDALDQLMEYVKSLGYIDYIRFNDLQAYKENREELYDAGLIDILKGNDKMYKEFLCNKNAC